MISAGLDIGSRTLKLVLMQQNEIIHQEVHPNAFHADQARDVLSSHRYDVLTATGYGRHQLTSYPDTHIISEIKAFALGVHHLYPQCRTILDIGGQDTKVISLDTRGRLQKFIMNDKCAAGTGRFLEIMALAMNIPLADFGRVAQTAEGCEKINSMCAVFAESEVISLLSRGAHRAHVARGIHQSIVSRAASLLQKIGVTQEVVFVGGVARNDAMVELLQQQLGVPVHTPQHPQIIGALGGALHGYRTEAANALS